MEEHAKQRIGTQALKKFTPLLFFVFPPERIFLSLLDFYILNYKINIFKVLA